ncbi:MAG: trigger factor [Lachnospiraceae bacterium]|nr:trigger factor [Lachnospiraceae bacterium]
MKKCLAVMMLATMIIGTMAGCGQSDVLYLKDMDVNKVVTVGDYKGLEITMEKTEATDEDVELIVEDLRANSPMTIESTTAAKEGDEVTFDFVGKLDGVAFDGGSGTDMTLVIGSGQFIPELEQGLIGIKAGEVKDVPARFPEEYPNSPDLAGKETVFTITMHSVRESKIVDELTDEHIANASGGEFATLDDYKVFVKEQLNQQLEVNRDSLLADAIITNSEFEKLPAAYVQRFNDLLTNNLTAEATNNGVDLSTFLMANGMLGAEQTAEEFIAEQAELAVKRYLTYQSIADIENLNPTDSEIDEALAEMAEEVGVTVEEYKTAMNLDLEAYREQVMVEKVSEFLAENAVIIEGEPTDDEAVVEEQPADGEADPAQ